MARKKKLKLSKRHQKQLRQYSQPLLVLVAGFMLGLGATMFWQGVQQPSNIVWAADESVSIPRDLRTFLTHTDNDCKTYRGADRPAGIGLWGVYQVSNQSYAKIAYGCSWALSSYIMAVKHEGDWKLITPAEYFAPFRNGVDPTKGALPFCEVVDRYRIPKDIEPFCVLPDGSAKGNEL